ncbi:MAG: flagellar biosynthesis protein [Clostridiaceae bacterium]|nr:flagellar biosynthesis protein [Clostridiaceae bacterium]
MIINNRPVSGIPFLKPAGAKPEQRNINEAVDFAGILQKKLTDDREVKISKHARLRMEMRNLNLNDNQRAKLSDAVDKADAKGVRNTLVVMDNMALVVNVKNRVVLTAINGGELKENVFTNIDGAVFAD